MKLGIWTNSQDATVDHICQRAPHWLEILRFNSDQRFDLTISNRTDVTLEELDLFWHRRPFENSDNPSSLSERIVASENEEALWNYVMQVPPQKWMNFPIRNWISDKKTHQLRLAEFCGLSTPDWIVTNVLDRAKTFLEDHRWDCILKPINSGYFVDGDSVYHIYTNPTNVEKINLTLIKDCPTLLQKRITKQFDVRSVHVNGATLFIALHGGDLDVRRDEMSTIKYEIIPAPNKVIEAYDLMMRRSELRFCTSDFVVTAAEEWFFLENNPNGQWVWMDEDLGGEVSNFFFNNVRNFR
jgi:hypothetical protein